MLNKLPAELVEMVAGHLNGLTDILPLRLTCRHLYHNSNATFAARLYAAKPDLFEIVTLDFTPRSIGRIEWIASHYSLNLSVQAIEIGVEQGDVVKFGTGNHWPRDKSPAFRSVDFDNCVAVQRLYRVLPRLVRCTRLSVGTCTKKHVRPLPAGDSTCPSLRDVFEIMFLAIARNLLPNVRTLEAEVLEEFNQDIADSPEFTEFWSHGLQKYTLQYCPSVERYDRSVEAALDRLAKASQLRSLRITSKPHATTGYVRPKPRAGRSRHEPSVHENFSLDILSTAWARTLSRPPITKLHLSSLGLFDPDLIGFLRCLRGSLEKLTLGAVQLWTYTDRPGQSPPTWPWVSLLDHLCDPDLDFPKLTSFRMALCEAGLDPVSRPIAFAPALWEGRFPMYSQQWEFYHEPMADVEIQIRGVGYHSRRPRRDGSGMADALRAMQRHMLVRTI